jgi:hypothetical protein
MMLLSWIPLLADTATNSEAYRQGQVIGATLMIIFAVICVIMAFVKRTKEWVVAGSICGFFLFARVALVGLGVGLAILGKTGWSPGTGAAEVITGKTIPYTIEKPAGWKVKRDLKSYDSSLTNGSGYVGVVAEKTDLGSNEVIAEFVRKRLESISTDLSFGDTQACTIDGRTWIGLTARCKVMTIPFTYQVYVHSGSEGTFQIWTWSFQNLWDSESSELNKIAQTVHLPSSGLANVQAPSSATSPAASPSLVTGRVIPFTIEEPAGWTLRRDISGYEMLLSDSRGYVAVIAERRNFGTAEFYAQSARKRIASVAYGSVLAGNQPAQINDRTWTCFTAAANLQNRPFAYLCYVYTGPEGSVQLTAWAPQDNWAQESPALDRVMRSFRFPSAVGSTANP